MSKFECVIVEAGLEDLEIIYNIDTQYEFDRYSKELIKESLNSSSNLNLIAYMKKAAVGYISVSFVVDEGEVLKIVVAEGYRELGIGSALIQDVVTRLKNKGVQVIHLEVRSNNIPAKRLYEKNGFVKISKRQKYYSDGADADIYRLNFL